MEHFVVESNRLNTVLGFAPADITRELELTIPLNPQVSIRNIVDTVGMLGDDGTALWLDRDCYILHSWDSEADRHRRYEISFRLMSNEIHAYALFQVPGTTELGTSLPALDYFIDRITSYDRLRDFNISPKDDDDDDDATATLDVSPSCFSNLLQTSRVCIDRDCSVHLRCISLTAEQTTLLFTHNTSPIFIKLEQCHFHGPTLLQLAAREQTDVVGGGGSKLIITLADEGLDSTPLAELTALLSIPHLRSFCPLFGGDISYEGVRKLVSALAANKISRLETLYLGRREFSMLEILGGDYNKLEIEWEREKESSLWIALWKAIEKHPSLKVIPLERQPRLCQHSWWQPIVAAVKVNPRLEHVNIMRVGEDCYHGSISNNEDLQAERELTKHVEPRLQINREINRYRPEIAALCRMDPSKAALLLGQAIVAVARRKHMKCRREILCMLLDQLVLTGHDFGVGRVLGKKRPLADTSVVVPNDVFATKTEPQVADGIAAPTLVEMVVVVPSDVVATKTEPQVADGIAAPTIDNKNVTKI